MNEKEKMISGELYNSSDKTLLNERINFVILGTGEEKYETELTWAMERHDNLKVILDFNRTLSKRIYAASDIFLMPSKREPCGLAQMIALRYGTIPIVRATGGLADTVIPFNHETGEGNGVNFRAVDENDMADAVWRAICIFNDKKQFSAIKKNAMSGDYSWNVSAKKYQELYSSIV